MTKDSGEVESGQCPLKSSLSPKLCVGPCRASRACSGGSGMARVLSWSEWNAGGKGRSRRNRTWRESAGVLFLFLGARSLVDEQSPVHGFADKAQRDSRRRVPSHQQCRPSLESFPEPAPSPRANLWREHIPDLDPLLAPQPLQIETVGNLLRPRSNFEPTRRGPCCATRRKLPHSSLARGEQDRGLGIGWSSKQL